MPYHNLVWDADAPKTMRDRTGGGYIHERTAEYREWVWEVLDDWRDGREFTSRQLWVASNCPNYQQMTIVLRKARELGWVRKVRHAIYQVVS